MPLHSNEMLVVLLWRKKNFASSARKGKKKENQYLRMWCKNGCVIHHTQECSLDKDVCVLEDESLQKEMIQVPLYSQEKLGRPLQFFPCLSAPLEPFKHDITTL